MLLIYADALPNLFFCKSVCEPASLFLYPLLWQLRQPTETSQTLACPLTTTTQHTHCDSWGSPQKRPRHRHALWQPQPNTHTVRAEAAHRNEPDTGMPSDNHNPTHTLWQLRQPTETTQTPACPLTTTTQHTHTLPSVSFFSSRFSSVFFSASVSIGSSDFSFFLSGSSSFFSSTSIFSSFSSASFFSAVSSFSVSALGAWKPVSTLEIFGSLM